MKFDIAMNLLQVSMKHTENCMSLASGKYLFEAD